MKKNYDLKLYETVSIALLTAIQIVLARFGMIPLMNGSMRLSLSFIPVVIAARSFGIWGGVLVYGLGDFIGAVAFPTTGAYFPGFTLTAVISGFIYGLFLSKKSDFKRIFFSVLCSQLLCTVGLNSLWICMLSGSVNLKAYLTLASSRSIQALVVGGIQIVFMTLFLQKICDLIKIPKKAFSKRGEKFEM